MSGSDGIAGSPRETMPGADRWNERPRDAAALGPRIGNANAFDAARLRRPVPILFGEPGDHADAQPRCRFHHKIRSSDFAPGGGVARIRCDADPYAHKPLAAVQIGRAEISLNTNRTLTVTFGW